MKSIVQDVSAGKQPISFQETAAQRMADAQYAGLVTRYSGSMLIGKIQNGNEHTLGSTIVKFVLQMLEQLGRRWCIKHHHEMFLSIPINGVYHCKVCERRYEVRW